MSSTMHFGPEWMRDKRSSKSRSQQPEASVASTSNTSYSSVLTPAPAPPPQSTPVNANPFKYSKEDILQVWKDGGGRAPLGLEVERWEGVIREVAGTPSALKEMTDLERKLFSTNVNSELRRRVSHELGMSSGTSSTTTRPKIGHASTTPEAPTRDRFGSLGRRRKEDASADLPASSRKLSVTINSTPIIETAPAESSALGLSSAVDSAVDDNNPWSAKRTPADAFFRRPPKPLINTSDSDKETPQRAMESYPVPEPVEQDALAMLGNLVGSLNVNRPAPLANIAPSLAVDTPPGLVYDPSRVMWSYLDPSSQIQGPFDGETMQKWHEQGYFSHELFMRREGIDKEWYPLAQFLALATGERFFLNHAFGPSAVRPPEFPILDHGLAAAVPQPIPATLSESSLFRGLRGPFGEHISTISPASQSPVSSFGRGFDARSSVSPDNAMRYGSDLEGYGTRPSFTTEPHGSFTLGALNGISPQSGYAQRSGTGGRFQETQSPVDYRSAWPPNGGVAATRNLVNDSMNGVGFSQPGLTRVNNSLDVAQGGFAIPPMEAANEPPHPLYSTSIPHSTGLSHLDMLRNAQGPAEIQRDSPVLPSSLFGRDMPLHNFVNQEVQYSAWPPTQSFNEPHFSPDQMLQTLESPLQHSRVGALDVNQMVDPVTWQAQYSENAASGGAENLYINSEIALSPDSVQPIQFQADPTSFVANVEDEIAAHDTREMKHPERPSRSKKAATETDLQTISKSTLADRPSLAEGQSAMQPKSAWGSFTEPSRDVKGGKTAIGFRELQEEEQKERESRKAKERQSKAATASAGDDVFTTASWGLPTSQVGSSRASKEKEPTSAPAGPSSAPPAPTAANGAPWSALSSAQAVKKSMREIQAEEEKQKNSIWEKEKEHIPPQVVPAPPKRGYADTATKVSQPSAPIPSGSGSGWKVVSGGKTLQATAPPAARNTPAAPAAPTATSKKASPVVSMARVANTAAKASPANSPSLDFLKWLKDALKGLNPGVNVDEFVQMLLSFPVDASQDTIELIQEQAYANSTTIDGRRFASEFITRRKADLAQPTVAQVSTGKAPSLADVVKAPQKQAQSDWGYKVVRKKGRSNKANN